MLFYQLFFSICLVGKNKYTVICLIVQNMQGQTEKPELNDEMYELGYWEGVPQADGCFILSCLEWGACDKVTLRV